MKWKKKINAYKLTIGFGTLAALSSFAAVKMYTASNALENNKAHIIHSTDLADAIMETEFALPETQPALMEIIEKDKRAELHSLNQQVNSFKERTEEADASDEELIANSVLRIDHVTPVVDQIDSLRTRLLELSEDNSSIDTRFAKLDEEDDATAEELIADSVLRIDHVTPVVDQIDSLRTRLLDLTEDNSSIDARFAKLDEDDDATAEELITDSGLGIDYRATQENMVQASKDIGNSINVAVTPAVYQVDSSKTRLLDLTEDNSSIDTRFAKLDEKDDEVGMEYIEQLTVMEDELEKEDSTSLAAHTASLEELSSPIAQTIPTEQPSVNPFTTEVSYIGDAVSNLSGGISKGSAYMGLLDVAISFETEKTGWWKGGTLFMHGQNTHGGTATESLVGDLQVLSNIENGNGTYLYELWYQQTLGPVSVLFGKHDLNAEFVTSEYAGHFLNSAFGIHSSIALNVPVSIFPRTSLGLVASVQFSDAVSLRMGVYDGSPSDPEVDPYNIDFSFNSNDGALAIGELQVDLNRNERHIGTYKVGSYYHSGTYELFNQSNLIRGNFGIYGVADIDIIEKSPVSGKGLSAFLQLGWAPSDRNLNDSYLGAGIHYSGLVKGRSDDVLGLAIAHAGISSAAILDNAEGAIDGPSMTNFESAIELSYKIQLSDQISFQPDVQYILNPGASSDLDDSVVALLRFAAQF